MAAALGNLMRYAEGDQASNPCRDLSRPAVDAFIAHVLKDGRRKLCDWQGHLFVTL